jgi:bifunctional non-homologous end joining protein LigD
MAKPRRTSPPRDDLAEYRAKRDFGKTPEPRGARARRKAKPGLRFVVQKHAASHLHFDLRLEVGGVMKSWAVPKGPSADPEDRRLAVEVEDHPVEYNTFEGTIPAGEYGGGTVMLWDRGTFTADDVLPGEDEEEFLADSIRDGKLAITFHGERLRGSYALVRTRRGEGKPQWLLIKHRDAHAGPGLDPAAEYDTSIDSGRTMEEIAKGRGGRRVWRSNRGEAPAAPKPSAKAAPPVVLPMLASPAGDAVPSGEGWTFEPKYDGIRVLAFVGKDTAALITRNGNDKARQFPEVASALLELRRELGRDVVLDGELVGMRNGEVVRFESLQARMHLASDREIGELAGSEPAAFVAFDLLLDGQRAFLREPWTTRREALEAVLANAAIPLQLGETSADADRMMERARSGGWEGLVAKRTEAGYAAGKRSRDWVKLKLENRQELVVGGWTEPRNSRQHIGALLLGYYDAEGRFIYAGHTGTGFDRKTLAEGIRRLKPLERKTSPFTEKPATNEKAHWTTPRVVVEVRFNEWTSKGKLRQPVFLGFRDDKDARSVVREQGAISAAGPGPGDAVRGAAPGPRQSDKSVAGRLLAVEQAGGDGVVQLGKGQSLAFTNLGKVYFPAKRDPLTKGGLARYYAEVSRVLLPWMKDRPLVLRRFPNGIEGQAFYQQTPDAEVPAGVRVETIVEPDGDHKRRLIGGDLATLLYTVQLGAISYDPWHSRVQSLEYADYTILDLDPGEGTRFKTVVEVARLVKEELDRYGLHGALKTSGSTGLHIYLPLPARTPLETATLLAQFVASRVAARAPKIATIDRAVKKRPRGTVYVDYLQNILGKTVAGVYAVRAKPGATVSTPLAWDELTADLDPRAFTLLTVPGRIAALGDLWGPAMKRPIALRRFLRAAPHP